MTPNADTSDSYICSYWTMGTWHRIRAIAKPKILKSEVSVGGETYVEVEKKKVDDGGEAD